MAWSTDFINALSASSITPIYEMEIVQTPINGSVKIYTDRGALQIIDASVDGTSVIPHRWSVSFGSFSVSLAGDITQYTQFLRRGCIAILRCRLDGLTNNERLSIGQLDSIRGKRGSYRLKFKDILSAFQARISKTYSGSISQAQFFYGTNYGTSVTGTFNPGDTSLSVADTSNFDKSSVHDGILYCQPTGGNPFYMRWSAKTSTTFTVSGSANHPSSVSAQVLPIGSRVTNAVRIKAAPHALFGQLITSTGTGTNGPLDFLPVSYGSGFPLPHDFFDAIDAQSTNSYIIGSGGTSYSIDFTAFEPISNGLRSIMDIFAEVGQWPVMRQNSFTWRGCFDPTGRFGNKPTLSAHIKDVHIISINSVDFFDPALKAVFVATNMAYNVAGLRAAKSITPINSLPIAGIKQREFGFYYDSLMGPSNMAAGDLDRMAIWDFYNWTKISLRVSLRFAVLCAGDFVLLSSRYIVDSYTQVGKTYVSRPAMVLEIGYNLNDRTCNIVLGVPPQF